PSRLSAEDSREPRGRGAGPRGSRPAALQQVGLDALRGVVLGLRDVAAAVRRRLLLEEELLRVDQPVVAQEVILDVAALDVSEAGLRNHWRYLLADRPDRERSLAVHADDLLEEGVSLRLVRLDQRLLPERPDRPDRVV